MSDAPPNGMPQIYPTLGYRDAHAAIEWLERVAGFERLFVVPGPDNTVTHAELRFGTGIIMVGTRPGAAAVDAPYVYVADVRAHYDRMRTAGADVTLEYEEKDYGGAGFSIRDPEGKEWSFGSYVPEGVVAPAH